VPQPIFDFCNTLQIKRFENWTVEDEIEVPTASGVDEAAPLDVGVLKLDVLNAIYPTASP
jgi:hypothetical protein